MSSGQLLCLLLTLPFYSSTNTSVKENIIVSSGDSALLLCPLRFHSSDFMRINVKWEKDGKQLCQYYIDRNGSNAPECNPEIKVNTKPSGLNIIDVKSSDAGLYKCLMTRIIPPPVEERNATLSLKVLSVTLQLVNSSCVELLCSLQGLESQQVNFTWTRATQPLHNETIIIMNNNLTLCKPNWTDRETLTCHAHYSNNHTVHKNVTLPCNSVDCNRGDSSWLIIAATSTCAGLFLLILLGVAIFKCKQRDEAVYYRNKIYENFTSNGTINPNSIAPQNAQSVTKTNIRSSTRSTADTIMQNEREECIYEN